MQEEKGLLLKMDLFFNPIVNGVKQGFLEFGNGVELSIKPNAERKDRVSKKKDTYGNNLSTVFIPQPADFKMVGDTMNIRNIALAQMGTVSDGSVVGGSMTDEPITAKLDRWVYVGQEFISNDNVQDNTNTTTYTPGSDYELNTEMGLFKALSTGGITEDQVLHFDCDYAGRSADVMQGMTDSNITGELRGQGINLETGEKVRLYVDEAVMTPDEAIDYLSSEWGKCSLNGTMNIVDGKTAPYELHDNVVSS